VPADGTSAANGKTRAFGMVQIFWAALGQASHCFPVTLSMGSLEVPVNSGPKMAENQRFEIAPTATPLHRSHGGKQRLHGIPCQGRQTPEAGAKGPPAVPVSTKSLNPDE
jgi:hypothetical protein